MDEDSDKHAKHLHLHPFFHPLCEEVGLDACRCIEDYCISNTANGGRDVLKLHGVRGDANPNSTKPGDEAGRLVSLRRSVITHDELRCMKAEDERKRKLSGLSRGVVLHCVVSRMVFLLMIVVLSLRAYP
jgi:hypothetical protein